MKSWAFYGVMFPGGEDRPYSYVTVQGFKDEAQMLGPAPAPMSEPWRAAHPTKDAYDTQKRVAAISHTATMEIGRIKALVRGSAAGGGGGGR